MTDAVFNLEQVAYTYRALPAVSGINWSFEKNQQWACLGVNGAGKTTLAGLISGQLQGTGVREIGHAYRRIAYVCFEQQKAMCARDDLLDDSEFRSDAQDPGTTVAKAILGARLPDQDFQYWAERLAISHILERGIRFISTGEMRKTLLLRAILSEPQLLILDSPLDGLDRNSQREIGQLIEDLLASNMRVLLLLRQIEDLPEGVDHLIVLDQGAVFRCGSRREILEDPAVNALMNPPPLKMSDLPAPGERDYQLEPRKPLLQLKNVNVSYDNNHVLQNLSWTFESGQHCCIAGPNGCGKTTLLSLINGDNHKAYGQDISLFGQRRGSGESVWEIKQKYGLLNTQLHLGYAKGMKVIEVVVSGFFDSFGLYDDWGDKQRQTASEWLKALGLANIETEPFDTLSFGIQRMVLLARAMVKSPAILILDEPCLGLDGFHRRAILAAIDHIAENSDTQILYVNHSPGEMPSCINQHLDFIPTEDGFKAQIS